VIHQKAGCCISQISLLAVSCVNMPLWMAVVQLLFMSGQDQSSSTKHDLASISSREFVTKDKGITKEKSPRIERRHFFSV
jgi:hypothetical protein